MQVASLIGQSVLLGELVQYFSSVSTTQFECDALAGDRNLTGTVSQAVDNNTLIRNAYLYALGKCKHGYRYGLKVVPMLCPMVDILECLY